MSLVSSKLLRRSDRLSLKSSGSGTSAKLSKIYKQQINNKGQRKTRARIYSKDLYDSYRVGQHSIDTMSEERVEGLEKAVGDINTEMKSVNSRVDDLCKKLDRLLEINLNATNDAGAGHRSTSDSVNQPNNSAQENNSSPNNTSNQRDTRRREQIHSAHAAGHAHNDRSHGAGPRSQTMDEYVQAEMDRDKFAHTHPGKYRRGDDVLDSNFCKPYMYANREGALNMRQKADARQSLSAIEYVDATLALLADTRAYDPLDYGHIMSHLRRVTRDAIDRPWPAVRRWSQYIWDAIESGAMTWDDKELIQEERVHICLTSATQQGGQGPQYGNRKANTNQEIVCRAYNSRGGCQFRDSHNDGGVYAMHICSYCDSVGRMCSHPVKECERRITHARQDYGSGRNRYSNGHGNAAYGHQHNGGQGTPYGSQQPKNGYMAHHQN